MHKRRWPSGAATIKDDSTGRVLESNLLGVVAASLSPSACSAAKNTVEQDVVTYIPHVEDAIWHEFSGYCGGRNASSGTPSSVSS
jgi:hypothetical protein